MGVATSNFAEVLPASFGGSARVLVGTGRYQDPVIVDGWSGYQHERNQVGNGVGQGVDKGGRAGQGGGQGGVGRAGAGQGGGIG